jgi:hypothetical protein
VAFIWQAGPQRGIRAVMRIESAPTDMVDTEADAKYWTDTRDRRLACRVRGTLTDRFPVIGVDEIQAMPGLQNLSILHAPQGTNFSLSGQEADLLHKLTHQLGVI